MSAKCFTTSFLAVCRCGIDDLAVIKDVGKVAFERCDAEDGVRLASSRFPNWGLAFAIAFTAKLFSVQRAGLSTAHSTASYTYCNLPDQPPTCLQQSVVNRDCAPHSLNGRHQPRSSIMNGTSSYPKFLEA
jgi:hypothetical protein